MRFKPRVAVFLEARSIVIVEIVKPDYFIAALQQSGGNVVADEARAAGNEWCHEC
jgi:hypothetical protein